MIKPSTPEHYKAMLSVLLVNPAKGTVRHARDIPHKGILAGDDAGSAVPRGTQISAEGYRVSRSKLIWFAATGEIPDRSLRRIDGNCWNDSISNLRKPALPRCVETSGGKFRAQLRINGSNIAAGSHSTVEAAAADAELMLMVRAAA